MPRGNLINALTGQTGGNGRKKDEEQSSSSAASPVAKPAQQRQQTQQYTDTGSNGVRQAEQVYSSSAASALPQTQTERNPFERLIDLATDTPQWQAAQQYNQAEQTARANNLPSQNDYWLSQQAPEAPVAPKEEAEKKSALDRFVEELTLTKQTPEKRNKPEQKNDNDVVKNLVDRGVEALANSPGAAALSSDKETLEQQRAETQKRYQDYEASRDYYAKLQADAESHLFYATDDYDKYDRQLQTAKAQQAAINEQMKAVQAELDKLDQALQFRTAMDNQARRESLENSARDDTRFDELSKITPDWFNLYEIQNLTADETAAISQMTNDQRAVYNYYSQIDQEQGTHLATEYVQMLSGELTDKWYQHLAEPYAYADGDNVLDKILKTGRAVGANLASGTNRALVGMDTMYDSDAPAYTDATQKAMPYANKAAGDSILYRSLMGAAQSVGQMIPSMMAGQMAGAAAAPFAGSVAAAGKAGQYASNAAFFSSIQGNAAAEAREKYGMGAKASNVYGTLVAATEVGLQSAIGGIAQFGGISETQLMDRIELIDNALLRAAAKYGANVAGELTEEELQNYLEPFYVSLLTGQEYELPTLQENLETALATVMMVTATGSGAEFASDLNQARAEAVQNAGLDFSDAGLQESWGMFAPQESAATNRANMNDTIAQNRQAAFDTFKQNAQAELDAAQAQAAVPDSTAGRLATNTGIPLDVAAEYTGLAQEWGVPQNEAKPAGTPKTQRRHTAAETRRNNEQIAQSIARQAADNGWFDEQLPPQVQAANKAALADYVAKEFGFNPTKAARLVNGALAGYTAQTETLGQNPEVQPAGTQPLSAEEQTIRDIIGQTGMDRRNAQGLYDLANAWGVEEPGAQPNAAPAQNKVAPEGQGVKYSLIDGRGQGGDIAIYPANNTVMVQDYDEGFRGAKEFYQLTDEGFAKIAKMLGDGTYNDYFEAVSAIYDARVAAPVQEQTAPSPAEATQAAPAQMQVQTAPAEQTAPAAVQNAAVTEGKSRPIQVDNAQRAQGTGEQRVSEAYDTITESPAIPDEFTQRVLKPSMENGEFNMTPDTNKAQLERGRSWVDEKLATNTVGDTVAAWKTLVSQGGTKTVNAKTLQAAGYTLLNRLANTAENTSLSDQQRREYDMLGVQVATNLQKVASNAGQLLQMQTMLQKMTPEMQIYSTKSAVEQLNETLSRRGVQVTLDQSLVNNLRRALESGDEAAISEARDALYSNIAEQMPMNVMDKLNAWRYLCMLGNPTTLIRNFFGNVGVMPVKAASGKVQAAVQSVLQKSGAIAQEQRTKYGGVLNASAEGRALLKWGKEYAAQLDSELSGEGKYTRTENAGTAIDKAWHEYNSQFKNPVLRGWQKATEFGLNSSVMGDALFLGHHFSNEIAQMAMARGYHLDASGQLVTKTGEAVSQDQMNDMTQRAIQEAKKATYRDTNAFTTLMKKMRSDSMSTGARVRNTLVDAVFPFISTPANIVARSVEYGPIGLAKTLLLETGKLRSGEISATDYVADLCDGLTGSSIVALGAYLAAQGLLTGAVVDDDDKREGKQKYSLNILGQHIPIDWLAPEAAVLLAGATLYEGFQSDGSKGLDSLYNMFGSYLDPIVQTSMLSGVSDLLDSKSYTTEPGSEHANLLYALTINAFMNYASQYIPTMWGKGTASARDQKTYTYTGDVEGNINKQWARTWGNFEKKLGVDVFGGQTRQQPSLDDWGRPTETGSVGQRLVQNYLLPYSATEDRTTPRDEAIRSLNDELRAAGLETGTQSVGPSKRGYTVNVKNAETGNTETVRLNGDQYTAYQRTYGETWAKLYDEVLEDPRYQSMTAAQKQTMLDTLDTVANERGKEAAGVGYTTDNKIAALMDEGLSFADAYDVAQWKSNGKDGGDRGVDAPRSAELWAYTAHLPGADGMEETELTREMRRVFEANGEKRYFAANAPDAVSVGLDTGEKVELSDEQKAAYMDQRGTVFENLANSLMEDQRYQDASDEEKLAMLDQAYTLAGESAKDSLGVGYESNSKQYSLLQTGLSTADIYEAKAYHDQVDAMLKESDNEDLASQRISTNARAATFKSWVDAQNWTKDQKDAVLDAYGTFYSMRGSDTEKYDAMVANGISGEQAAELMRKMSSLEPLEGAASVSDAQRWELIVNSDLSAEQKNTAMWLQMDKSQRKKFEQFMDSGLGAEDYYKIYTAKATHGNEKGNWTVDTLAKYLRANYTAQESYFIWPIFSTGKNRFSAAAPKEHQGGIPEQTEDAAPQSDNAGGAAAGTAGNAAEASAAGGITDAQGRPIPAEDQDAVERALARYRAGRLLTFEEWTLLNQYGLMQ